MKRKKLNRLHWRAAASGVLLASMSCVSCKKDSTPTTQPSTPTPVASAPTVAAPATATAVTPAVPASTQKAGGPAPGPIGFDADPAGAPPPGFRFARTGQGKSGMWVVRTETDAPSKGNVLAQTDTDSTDYRFPLAIRDEPTVKDARIHVKCKQVAGRVDQACGLVFRYQDENNYLLTRANALENNVRLYFVKDGNRKQIASWSGAVKGGVWHDLQAVVRGDHIEVTWDGTKVLDHHDQTFTAAGRVGLWTKADSVTYFDDLTIEPQ